MEAGAVLCIFSALLGTTLCQDAFYGQSATYSVLAKQGEFEVMWHQRQNGRGSCSNHSNPAAVQTDQDSSSPSRWCQSEGLASVTIQHNASFTLSESQCCWASNVYSKQTSTFHTQLDLGTRSDTHTLNKAPVTATVAALRVPQNCFSKLPLLAYDPDGDIVRCRFASNATVDSNVTIDEGNCELGSVGPLALGLHVLEVVLEDHPARDVNLSYADGSTATRRAFNVTSPGSLLSPPLSAVTLLFTLEVLSPLPNCFPGHVVPRFVSPSPSHGSVLQASVGDAFQLHLRADAKHANVTDFQLSGPVNMSKVLQDETLGRVSLRISWTPQDSDVFRSVPLCYTAETAESQSEMRCVILMVTRSAAEKGIAHVSCAANKMTVELDKASMPGIDRDWLKLLDPSCSLTSNATHIMGSMSLTTCGTTLEDTGDFLIFKNEIDSFELPTSIITRKRSVKIGFFCQFPKSISLSSHYQLHQIDYLFTESAFGSFGYTFEIFTDGNYSTRVEPSQYPVQVKLMDMIYMGIQAQSDLPDVTLFVESCSATPEETQRTGIIYPLINNGCVMDETLQRNLSSDLKSFNFEIQAFKFTGNYDEVFITCSVILCETGNPVSRCAQGCMSDPTRRRRRSLKTMETGAHYITQGPFQVVRPTDGVVDGGVDPADEVMMPGDQFNDGQTLTAVDSPEPRAPEPRAPEPRAPVADAEPRAPVADEAILVVLNSKVGTVFFASAFIAAVAALAFVIGYFSKKNKKGDPPLLDSDEEI